MGKKKQRKKTHNPIAATEQKLTGTRAGAHSNRTRDLRKGSSRKTKHKTIHEETEDES